VFEAIRALMEEPERPKRKTGFTVREKRAAYAVKQKKQEAGKKNLSLCTLSTMSLNPEPFPASSENEFLL
jgi:hypothetical protein